MPDIRRPGRFKGWDPDDQGSTESDADSRAAAEEQIREGRNLCSVWRIWETSRGARPMPAPTDIDPADLPLSLLPYLMVVGVEAGPRFRYRLVGSAIVLLTEQEWTGKYVDTIMPARELGFVQACYMAAVTSRRPVYARMEHSLPQRPGAGNAFLTLPLSSDGDHVDRLLIANDFQDEWQVICAWRDSTFGSYTKSSKFLVVL